MSTVLTNRMPTRIGIDVTAAYAQGGGIGRYTRELVRALVTVDKISKYRLFSARPSKPVQVREPIPPGPNITLRQLKISDQWLYRFWYRLRIPFRVTWIVGKIDIYHSPDFVLPPIGSVPSVLTVHDLSFIHHPEAFTPSLLNYLNQLVPDSVRNASHILADSQCTKDDLLDIWQVPEEKVTVVYSGVSSWFKPVTDRDELSRIQNKYHLGDRPYVLSVGTLQPRKNYEMLIRAFKPVAEIHDHQLVIVGGKGWMYDRILEEATKDGIDDRVTVTGFVDDYDLPGIYSGASLLAFPSLYEGFGLPLLEAMSCGVPVISSNTSSLPEVAGEAAILLSPNDQELWSSKLKQLLDDSTERMTMVAAGYLQARKFSWRQAAEQVLTVYQSLL